ncbi:gamma-mobile-trio protein GmtX [Aeromonas veronii]|uniref:gamma-mobile-trio protein GmtX n=1 Tax=Aeromonas veronii TaxID=654 RepID=UPI001EEE581E|nr:gamma-mobile-trio protein GmtX [Aeromonas veronii]MCF7743003.1 hypothetical protein [Aeromonas veronii]MCO4173862.1 hypothetical protein [Aeromonas veronii]
MELSINTILDGLKSGKTARTRHALDTLNGILEVYVNSGKRDFSITQIGRISSAKNGPGYASLRATKNKHFRDLIEAWAAKCNTTTKKPLSDFSRSREVPSDYKLLERIQDPAVRTVFGQIISERNKYLRQLNLLKQNVNIVIDKRPATPVHTNNENTVQVFPGLSGLLIESEIKALQYSISEECLERHNWQVTQVGQIKEMEFNTEIFPRGFATGLKKILAELESF